ncbi:efflux RND transporter periplasmic adaptor subunit [Burkholderia multivorans]|uniref:efflux RND transporter periplasmic adaptor subunit n=1 Tax=Burkholderia multivorans TaxID=87883 RepID=UPI001C211DCE|nr:efflux RND transporter periplasmic adaptor subunit [Burkholderia multivorans]MBU9618700.1 efflux RND transporter periplasmic adaptor subunit [Burkholderia multivorans]
MTHATPSKRRRYLPALILIAVAAAIVVIGLVTRWSRAEQLREDAQTQSVRTVAVILPSPIEGSALALPGRIEAWSRAPIYARVSGYLKRWSRDIGEPVKAGQVLAEIDTPDVDQELQQARAELARARSEAALADTTARRWQSLLTSDSVSRQEVEERVADHTAKQAAVNALQANVERLQAMQQYRRLTAPFDGIVTARNTDVGALINVGSSVGSELFVVSDVRRLRIYVNVPQRQVAAIRSGAKALVNVPERPGETFEATVQSLAQAIDASTGAMRVQLTVDNADGRLLPGGFATVRFEAVGGTQALGLPPSALIVGRNGVQVALVDDEGRTQLRPVTIARDLGRVVELTDGVRESDRVINSPPDGIADGDVVRIAAAAQEPAK